jgi:hypothetical protein
MSKIQCSLSNSETKECRYISIPLFPPQGFVRFVEKKWPNINSNSHTPIVSYKNAIISNRAINEILFNKSAIIIG